MFENIKKYTLEFNPTIKEIKTLTTLIQSQNLYIEIFNIDLTTLNGEFGYEKTTKYKNQIITTINQLLQNNLIYTKILGGKILTITKTQLTPNEKKKIIESGQKTINNDERRFVLIKEKIIINEKNISPKELLKKYLSIEIYLKQQRENIQKVLSKVQSSKKINELHKIWEKSIQEHKKININLNKKNIRELLQYAKHSLYLTQALYAYGQNNQEIMLQNTLTYKIWYELQGPQFESHTSEKIKSIIERERTDEKRNIIKAKFKIQTENILEWFNASIKSIYPYLSTKEIQTAKQINQELQTLTTKPEQEIETQTKQTLNKITQFTNSLNIKGFQSVPIDNLTPNQASRQFIQRQIYLNFQPKTKEEWNNQTNKYYSQNFIKPEYKGFIKGDSNSILNSTLYLNQELIKNNPSQNIAFAFLEIDFFNAFNSYLFPTDSDKFYQKLIDIVFEISNKYIIKHHKIFKTLNIGLLGDEFFFLFLTENEITKEEIKTIKKYLIEINNKMLKITKTNLLIKSEKKEIKKDNSTITIRIPLEKTGIFTTTPKFEIGKISFSKFLLIKNNINFQNPKIKEEFEKLYNKLDKGMKKIKQNKTPKIVVEHV